MKEPGDAGFRFRSLVLTRKKRPGILVWLVLFLGLYWLGGSILLPRWALPLLEKELSGAFGTNCIIGRLTVDPFTLRITADDMLVPYPETIARSAGRDFIRLKRLEARIALSSLSNRALVVDELRFLSPEIHITRHRDGSLSPQHIFAADRGSPGARPVFVCGEYMLRGKAAVLVPGDVYLRAEKTQFVDHQSPVA